MQRFDVIAATMQQFVEDVALQWIRNCIAETKIRHLALAGGLFMNVKLNQKILAFPEVDSLYVMPSAGDESTPIGACYWGATQEGVSPKTFEPLCDLYLGPTYDNHAIDEAVRALAKNGVEIQTPESIEDAVAELLAQGEIIAWYQGREEFGARALGHRSILADPSRLEGISELNKAIKNRDFWMPFAGSMTDVQAARVLVNPKQHIAPYMVITFDIQEHADDFRATTHPYDETIRPQVVKKEWNPSYYQIIELFEKKTGKHGGILNTSFNLHGYPIVSSPADALEVFEKSGLRYLAIGSYLISKK